MSQLTRKFIAPLALTLMLPACALFNSNQKWAPDEFEVVERAPLVVPPNADLRPPRPGAPRAQDIAPTERALNALFPGQAVKRDDKASAGEKALLKNIRTGGADARSTAAHKDTKVVKKSLLLADLLAAKDRSDKPDNISIERLPVTTDDEG